MALGDWDWTSSSSITPSSWTTGSAMNGTEKLKYVTYTVGNPVSKEYNVWEKMEPELNLKVPTEAEFNANIDMYKNLNKPKKEEKKTEPKDRFELLDFN